MIARGRIRIQRMRRGKLRSQPRNLAAVSLNVLGQRRLGGGSALLWGQCEEKEKNKVSKQALRHCFNIFEENCVSIIDDARPEKMLMRIEVINAS